MKVERYFTIPMAIVPLGAVVTFASKGQWKLAVYWFLIAALNGIASTF